MALTKEDLQAIAALMETEREYTSRMMDSKLEPIKDDIADLKRGQVEMQSDIRQLNQTVAKIEVEHGHKLSVIYDAHEDTVRNASTLKELGGKVEDHGVRIWALEEAVRIK